MEKGSLRHRTMRLKAALLFVGLAAAALVVHGVAYHGSAGREIAKRAACASNLKRIYEAMMSYRRREAGKWPSSLDELHKRSYVRDRSVLQCSLPDAPAYVYLQPPGSVSSDSVLAYDENHLQTGRGRASVRPVVIVLFADGRVQQLAPRRFRNALRGQSGEVAEPDEP